ncbi:hypothetical protein CRG98_024926 [Punica granatum]|uniref:Uncharacterized protein n=1 Tax=Punica granatum TaxID=22663 RepID=A0A2I0JGF8_PUNGR|nr:hypothetical protein CRG98_024926 [Punica granatum]
MEKEEEAASALKQLQESVDAHPDDPNLHFDLGVHLWEKGGGSSEDAAAAKDRAAEHFLNPQNAAAFRYLGHYYGEDRDAQRAIKCYQRAVTLNADDREAGEAACNLLDREGKESLEVAVCREASDKSPRAFWAFRRLGYLQVHKKKWSEAVPSLQSAIRGYPSCTDLWEALGLAYQRLGMYTAAIKSYGRAIELDSARIFARVESGNIFMMLGSFRKGIEQFEKALEISPQNLSANYGLASALFGLSRECINTGAFRWGASLLEDASKVMRLCTQLAGNQSSVWKLDADIQILYSKCFPWMVEEQALQLDAGAFNKSILSWNETCCSAARSARISYQKALHVAPWCANIYMDIAISSDLISSLNGASCNEINSWQLPEKMALGALLLECENYESWVALGCLSDHDALKQHSLIRALQLDASLAGAWAHLGKLYRRFNKQLARQAFDSARSIDPSLALPWAGMSADSHTGEVVPDEAFESCLRAVQILPLAEFQIGLTKLALLSGYSASSQVFGAICQAVQRAPNYPESHNLKGLIFEARRDYQSAVASYRAARHAISRLSGTCPESCMRDVTVNLARSLSKLGNALDAVRECDDLTKEGPLDEEGLHIYAYSLWQLGNNELALSTARNLAAKIPSMEKSAMAASVSFICRLLYYISGLDSAINSILKMPKNLFESANISFILSAVNVFDENGRLNQIISGSRRFLTSHADISEMHFLIALSKLIKNSSEFGLGYQTGIHHLRKALHMFPNSNLLRQSLGYLLLLSKRWTDSHVATRCSILSSSGFSREGGPRSAYEILGAGAVACYAVGNSGPKFSFPTCPCQSLNQPQAVQQLQRWLHQEPWNPNARYLLILNLLQRAREEKFPPQLCGAIGRLIHVALSIKSYPMEETSFQHQRFQLLLCASEMSFQEGNQVKCINHAREASELLLPHSYLFFAHLLLCRAYAVEGDSENVQREFLQCLKFGTDFHIGWISLKLMQLLYNVENDSNILDSSLDDCLKKRESSRDMCAAVFNLIEGLVALHNKDFASAEEFLAQACSLMGSDSCSLLCHGVACMQLAKWGYGAQFLSDAIRSLQKVRETAIIPLPIVSTLLAQAEGSLGSRDKWEQNLRLEWYTWSPEMRPAELYFQMHLLSEHSNAEKTCPVVRCQSPLKWVSRAIHVDPSSSRYWKILQKHARPTALEQCT